MKSLKPSKYFFLENRNSEIIIKSNDCFIHIKNKDIHKRFNNLLLLHAIFKYIFKNIILIIQNEDLLNQISDIIKNSRMILSNNLYKNNIICFNNIQDIKKIINFSPYTLTFLLKKNQILLGLKKRGFGEGYYNGFGGKVQNHESIIDAARREVLEECNIQVNNLIHKAKLYFIFEHSIKPNIEGYVFISNNFIGTPKESDEMKPVWFTIPDTINQSSIYHLLNSIPFQSMWQDDIFWLPFLFSDNFINGFFILNDNNHLVFTQLLIDDFSEHFTKINSEM